MSGQGPVEVVPADAPQRQAPEPAPRWADLAVVSAALVVIDGEVLHSYEIEPYPQARTALGGCTSFAGRYVTDPDEVAAIRRRVEGGAR
jgi:hypothetical protein